jgi:hypothetical protein
MVSSPSDDFLQNGMILAEQRSYESTFSLDLMNTINIIIPKEITHVRSLTVIERKLDELCEVSRFETNQALSSEDESKSK